MFQKGKHEEESDEFMSMDVKVLDYEWQREHLIYSFTAS